MVASFAPSLSPTPCTPLQQATTAAAAAKVACASTQYLLHLPVQSLALKLRQGDLECVLLTRRVLVTSLAGVWQCAPTLGSHSILHCTAQSNKVSQKYCGNMQCRGSCSSAKLHCCLISPALQ
jgi:hypothetical protein